MRKLFIINPSALRDKVDSVVNKIKTSFGENISIMMTTKGGDAENFARFEDTDEIFAVGGDGTVCDAVNGLGLRMIDRKPLPALAVIPAGSGNDFSRAIYGAELPVDTVINRIVSGVYVKKRSDLGRIAVNGGNETKFFTNIASVGFDAEIVKNSFRYKKNPLTRKFSYILSIFYTIFKFKGVDIEIECNGETTSEKMLLAAVANGSYYGGGIKIAPDADLCDGEFDIISAPMLKPFQILCILPKLLDGSHVKSPLVTVRRCTKISFKGNEEQMLLNLDGELSMADSAEFEILPSAVEIYCKN